VKVESLLISAFEHTNLGKGKLKMTTTITTLKKQLKAANRRVDKAIDIYRIFTSKLFMPWGDKIVNVADIVFHRKGSFEYASDLSEQFYRRGRGGKFYVKPFDCEKRQPCTWCTFCDGSACDNDSGEKFYCRDYLDLRELEAAIDKATDERERLLSELEAAGVDPYTEKDLW